MGVDPITLGIIGSIGSSVIGASSANKAAKAQAGAAKNDLELQERIYGETTDRFAPFLGTGTNALQALAFEQGIGDQPEGYQGISLSPAARFATEQGRDTIEAGAAGRGNLFSGASLQSLEKMRTNIATGDRDNQLNRLAFLANMGQSSAGAQAQAGQNFATGAGNAFSNIGNAQSAGSIGVGNAIQGGIGNAMQLYQYGQAQQQGAFNNANSGVLY